MLPFQARGSVPFEYFLQYNYVVLEINRDRIAEYNRYVSRYLHIVNIKSTTNIHTS